MINALYKAGRIEGAQGFLAAIQANGLVPDDSTYSTVMI
jgi:pentatricopeptide repeat protein